MSNEEIDGNDDIFSAFKNPPIAVPFILTFTGFLITTIITAVEILSSSPPQPSLARQTPSPHTTRSSGVTLTRANNNSRRSAPSIITAAMASGSSNTAAAGQFFTQKGYSVSDSPESMEDGPTLLAQRSFNNGVRGKSQRPSSRNKLNAVLPSHNYGSFSRNSYGLAPPNTTNTTGVSTPGDDSVGGGSSGDNTRRYFYNCLFIALFSRMIFLPFEASFISTSEDPNNTGCLLSRTLPDLIFATAFSLLVLFYAQLVGTAKGGPTGLSLFLLRPGYFRYANLFIYLAYFFLLLSIIFFPRDFLHHMFQSIIWLVLSVLYFTLFLLLSYFGPALIYLLRPSLEKRSALAIRLISMCAICSIIFICRSVNYAFGIAHNDIRFIPGLIPHFIVKAENDDLYAFQSDCWGYVILELIPSLFILFMMHQKRRQPPNSSSITVDTARDGVRYVNNTQFQQQGNTSVSSPGLDINSRRIQNAEANITNSKYITIDKF